MKKEPVEGLIAEILDRVREARSFDFRSYKHATLRRRIERRMSTRRCTSHRKYIALLRRDPAECDALISEMLIKATSFFRDPAVWDQLERKILPGIFAKMRADDELRIWSAGCSTGEEAYSLAILCAEMLGPAFYQRPIKIFATDVDAGAVATARRGIYSAAQLAGLGKARLARWFVQCPEGFQIHPEVRRAVVFGVNSLTNDPPISRLDLILCRNVFIYLGAPLQKRVLSRLHYALRPDGVLLLGKSELIPYAAKVFQPLDLKRRLYAKGAAADRALSAESIARLLEPAPAAAAGGGVVAHDPTKLRALETKLEESNAERQTANEELQTTNEELQSSNEELHTTNEELQSTNEELETTNEELQSTNEELETTNEELQSTNAELDTTNRELAFRTDELNRLTFCQRTLLRSLTTAVVGIDPMGRITSWNLAAERLLGLPEAEAMGQVLWTLRVPAWHRQVLTRVRKSLSGNLALRQETPYELPGPGGGLGRGALVAVPLVDESTSYGAVLLFDDRTLSWNLAAENHRLRDAGRRKARKP